MVVPNPATNTERSTPLRPQTNHASSAGNLPWPWLSAFISTVIFDADHPYLRPQEQRDDSLPVLRRGCYDMGADASQCMQRARARMAEHDAACGHRLHGSTSGWRWCCKELISATPFQWGSKITFDGWSCRAPNACVRRCNRSRVRLARRSPVDPEVWCRLAVRNRQARRAGLFRRESRRA